MKKTAVMLVALLTLPMANPQLTFAQTTTETTSTMTKQVATLPILEDVASIEDIASLIEAENKDLLIGTIQLFISQDDKLYQVEAYQGQDQTTYYIDALTKEILDQKASTDDDQDDEDDISAHLANIIDMHQAADLALKEIGAGQVVYLELEPDDNNKNIDWLIQIQDGQKYHEVTIDALTGKVTEVDHDEEAKTSSFKRN